MNPALLDAFEATTCPVDVAHEYDGCSRREAMRGLLRAHQRDRARMRLAIWQQRTRARRVTAVVEFFRALCQPSAWRHVRIGLLFVLALPTLAGAGIITPGHWSALQPGDTGTQFYQQGSEDGPHASISWVVGPLVAEALTNGGWAAPFVASGLTGTFTIISERGDYAGANRFGWFDAYGTASGEIFSGPDSAGISRTVTLPAIAGFYLTNALGQTFTSTLDYDHFALFRRETGIGTTFVLGLEDLASPSVRDYNDLVVQFSIATACGANCRPEIPPSVPEPGTLCLLGSGLITLARRTRRSREGSAR